MTSAPAAVVINEVTYHYGPRRALNGLSLAIASSEIFALVGPNGGGKSTLFRLLTTLVPLQRGTIRIGGYDVAAESVAVRRLIGVVFQSSSLDRHLTVAENLRHQGRLYGLTGAHLRARCDELLARLNLADRARDPAGALSGGLRRRAEVAKGLLHRPAVLLLDEPTTGLDPGARSDLWRYLTDLRRDEGLTVVATTHLLEEAERADRVGILDQGRLVALDAPARLRAELGHEQLIVETEEPAALAARLSERLHCNARVVAGSVRVDSDRAAELLPQVWREVGSSVRSLTVARPTLEDVFLARTGHQFDARSDEARP